MNNNNQDSERTQAIFKKQIGHSFSASILNLSLCILFSLASFGCYENPDDRDWRSAKNANNPDSYITYLVAHPNGAFASEARKAARNFLTFKYTEIPGTSDVLITNDLGDLKFYSISGEIMDSMHVTQHVTQEGNGYTYDNINFQFRPGNAILQPRISSANMLFYYDQHKGMKLSGFEILLRGKSQSVPIFQIPGNDGAPPPTTPHQ